MATFNNRVEEIALTDVSKIGADIPTVKDALVGLTDIYRTLSKIYSATENMSVLSTFTDTELHVMNLVSSEEILTMIAEKVTEKNREVSDVSMLVTLKRVNEVESGVKDVIQDIRELKGTMMSKDIS